MKRLCLVLFLGLIMNMAFNAAGEEGESKMIEKGRKVKFDYTLTVDGKTIDSSQRSGPLEDTQGEGNNIIGLERRMDGLKVGDKRMFTIPAEEAYGQVNPNAFQDIPKSSLPKDIAPQEGQVLEVQDSSGRRFPALIWEVREKTILLNLNHPLAGKELQFDITILEIQ